jgi:hypothetical protein
VLHRETVPRDAKTLALALALLPACGACDGRATAPVEVPSLSPEEPPEPIATIEPVVATVPLEGGGTYALHRFRFDLGRTRIDAEDLAFQTPLRAALERSRATLAVNGGFWDTDRQPEGLTIDGDRRIGAIAENIGGGLLVVDDASARLYDVEAEGFEPVTRADLAIQAKPRLVVDRAVNARDTGRRADRTALCIRDEGRTLDLYIARTDDPMGHGGPSLYDFAEKLVEEGCEQALNLDGGGSTGVAWRGPSGLEALSPRTDLRVVLLFFVDEGQTTP